MLTPHESVDANQKRLTDNRYGQRFIDRLLHFGNALRENGILVSPGQMMTLIDATRYIGVHDRGSFQAAAKACLVTCEEDLTPFDEVFPRFWQPQTEADSSANQPTPGGPRDSSENSDQSISRKESFGGAGDMTDYNDDNGRHKLNRKSTKGTGDAESIPTFSDAEVLRHKYFSEFTEDELALARQFMKHLEWNISLQRSRRKVPSVKGRLIDYRKTMRKSLQTEGVPLRIFDRTVKNKPRMLVVICDISGSMDRYSRLLLHFVHTIQNDMAKVEAFVFGTRLTRLTRVLKNRPIDEALNRASKEVQDWAGGTRIGESLRTLNREWARCVLHHGAVVLLISDGCDRGDPELLAKEMSRLQRSSYRLVWLNPLLGLPCYQPLTHGIQAALPFIDDFLPVHNLESLELLARHLSDLNETRPVRRQARRTMPSQVGCMSGMRVRNVSQGSTGN